MSLPTKPNFKQRSPHPVLFLPPSPGASHASLTSVLGSSATSAGIHNLKRDHSNVDPIPPPGPGSIVQSEQQRLSRTLQALGDSQGTDRTDALWAEMQATLEEVELSASEGTHVFGPEHDCKLADLRATQINLAQAWARSEADDAMNMAIRDQTASATGDELPNLKGTLSDPPKAVVAGEGTDPAKSLVGTASIQPGNSGGQQDRLGAKLEEETEADILLARKRREANDEYFQRVNDSVIDVVTRLESVAVAMRAVEQETQDLWQEDNYGLVADTKLATEHSTRSVKYSDKN